MKEKQKAENYNNYHTLKANINYASETITYISKTLGKVVFIMPKGQFVIQPANNTYNDYKRQQQK